MNNLQAIYMTKWLDNYIQKSRRKLSLLGIRLPIDIYLEWWCLFLTIFQDQDTTIELNIHHQKDIFKRFSITPNFF